MKRSTNRRHALRKIWDLMYPQLVAKDYLGVEHSRQVSFFLPSSSPRSLYKAAFDLLDLMNCKTPNEYLIRPEMIQWRACSSSTLWTLENTDESHSSSPYDSSVDECSWIAPSATLIINEVPFFLRLVGNIDANKSSITNGICCSTNSKNTKAGRKNSNISQQEFDKKPLSNNNNEHFDGIDQIIANANTGTLKPAKKSNQSKASKSQDRKKLHGSLPNHLDTDVEYEGSDDTNSSGESKARISPSHPLPFDCQLRPLSRAEAKR